MTSLISWIAIGLIITILFYAMFSLFLKRPIGLFIAAAFHIELGILSLPSIGLYVWALAALEIIAGIAMLIKSRRSHVHSME